MRLWLSGCTLKAELVDGTDYPSRASARTAVFEFIEVFYNRQRLHSTLDYRTPSEFESVDNPKAKAASAECPRNRINPRDLRQE